jgi:PAS domain S-box-containing protein
MANDGEPAAEVPGDPADRHSRGGGPAILVMSSASDVEVALLDLEGRIVCVNDAWARFCADNGGDASRCGVGVSYLDICDGAGDDGTAALVAASVRSALLGDLPAPLAVDVPCHSSGELRWFDVLVSSRLDDDGACMGATVTLSLARVVSRAPSPVPTVAVDPAPAPTGWPRGERCAELLGDGVAHAVFAVAPCAVLLADDDGRIIAANAQADELFGTGAGGLMGRLLDQLLPPHWGEGRGGRAADEVPQWTDPAYSGRAAVGSRPDGSYVRVQIASAPVPLSYGTGVLVTASASPGNPGPAVAGNEALLVDLDVVLRRIFSAGLALTGVRERLERDGVPARVLTEAIGDLDRAAKELRHAARGT